MSVSWQSTGAIDIGTSTTRTPAVPSGVVNGSLVVECLAVVANVSPTTPTGFTNKSSHDGSNGPALRVAFKRATGSESGTYSVPTGSAATVSSSQCFRFEDENTATDPFGGVNNNDTDGVVGATSPSVSLTGVTANDILIWVLTTSANRTTTGPTGFTRLSDSASQGLHVFYRVWTGGDTGSITATIAGGNANMAAGLLWLKSTDPEGTGSLANTATLTASGATGVTQTATALAVTATLAAGGVVGLPTSANLPVTATTTASGDLGLSSAATSTITATTSAAGVVGVSTGASLIETIAFTSTGALGVTKDASFAGTVTLTAAGVAGFGGTAALPETATLTAAGQVGRAGDAALAGTVTLTADGQVGVAGSATLPITVGQMGAGAVGVSSVASLAVTAVVVAEGVAFNEVAAPHNTRSVIGDNAAQTLIRTNNAKAVIA